MPPLRPPCSTFLYSVADKVTRHKVILVTSFNNSRGKEESNHMLGQADVITVTILISYIMNASISMVIILQITAK